MNKSDPMIERLQQELVMLPGSKPVSSPIELAAVRCPLCGDSPHKDSAHMYIGLREIQGKTYIMYDCKLCSASGMINSHLLRMLNINDVEVEEYIKSQINTSYVRTFSQEDDTSGIIYKYPHPSREDKEKVDYMSERLQMDFSDYENIKKYRVVFSFSKFIGMNKIEKPGVSPDLIPLLDEQGIGFISADKTSISIRNQHPDEYNLKRFNIIHLYENVRHPYMYIPPTRVDVLTPFPHIAVSESSFNIINIQNYFYGKDDTNTMFASCSRKGCESAILKLIGMTGFTGGKLDIYADNDKTFSVEFFEDSLKQFLDTFDTTIFLNTKEGEKDFGKACKPGEKYEYDTIKI